MNEKVKHCLSKAERVGLMSWIPSPLFLKMKYRRKLGRPLDLKHPRGYNEKLQAMKLRLASDPKLPDYTRLADKVTVKSIVASMIGEEHIIPTLGVWNRFDDIDFDSLPNQFVLKTNHDSGGVVIVRDRSKLDRAAARKRLNKRMRRNFYWFGREPQYRRIPRRIFAEKLLTDGENEALRDYKFFCFDGEPRYILTVEGGHGDESRTKRRMYDSQWNLVSVGLHGKKCEPDAEPVPEKLDEMLEIARGLSKGFPHLRVDLYLIQGQIYFGELTFAHMSGMERFDPPEFDLELGSWLHL